MKTLNVIKNGLSKKPAIKIASALGIRVWNLLDRTSIYRRARDEEKQQQQKNRITTPKCDTKINNKCKMIRKSKWVLSQALSWCATGMNEREIKKNMWLKPVLFDVSTESDRELKEYQMKWNRNKKKKNGYASIYRIKIWKYRNFFGKIAIKRETVVVVVVVFSPHLIVSAACPLSRRVF